VALTGVVWLQAATLALAQPALESYYVTSPMERGDRLVDVTPEGNDVRVRAITLVNLSEFCPSLVVRAADEVLPETTIEATAGVAICSLTQLDGYTGPPEEPGPLPIELVDQGSFQFVKYVPLEFPPIALSARVFADVPVRLEVDGQSGRVTRAEVIDGSPILHEAALKAARQWEFVPGTTPVNPFEVTLAFQLRCASR
jgi:TonB family protein